MNYTVTSLSENSGLLDEMNRIGGDAWPEFMLHDPVALAHWMDLVDAFKEYQLLLMHGAEILAIVNTAPLSFSKELTDLPDEGVDWGVKKVLSDHRSGMVPNVLMGVQVVVAKSHSGRGLSAAATQEMLKLARHKGFRALIVPLRPSNKHEYPLVEMNDYIHWKNKEGLPFDNWLRVHMKAGGEILGVCRNSM